MKIKGIFTSPMIVAILIGLITLPGGEIISRMFSWGEIAGTAFFLIGCLIMAVVIGFIAPSAVTVTSLFLCAYSAIVIGEFVDIEIDWFFRHRDRNLWPLEIVVLFVLAFLPVVIGIKAGRRIKQYNENNKLPNKPI